jgi:hypothetical protein
MKSTIGKFVVITIGILVIIIIYLSFKNYTMSLKIQNMNNEMNNLQLTYNKNKVSKKHIKNLNDEESISLSSHKHTTELELESDNDDDENNVSSELNNSQFIENYANDNFLISNDKEMIIPININTLLQKAIEEQMLPVMMHCVNETSFVDFNKGLPKTSVEILSENEVKYNNDIIDEFFRSVITNHRSFI